MVIHALAATDVSRFRKIRLRALNDAPHAFATTHDDAQDWPLVKWHELFSGLVALVATERGEDIGKARVAADLEESDATRLASLWVDPVARGRGVGSALIDAAVVWARSGTFDRVLLDAAADNMAVIAGQRAEGVSPHRPLRALSGATGSPDEARVRIVLRSDLPPRPE
jgi:GNAT superfamily N-acetyltransferase